MNVLVVAPHPDDETIGCGGTIRLHVLSGDRVDVVFLTSGELGVPDREPDDARAVREAEAERAAGILGVTDLTFLRHPDWFVNEVDTTIIEQLRSVVDRTSPGLVYFPHENEWHPDHAAAGTLAPKVAAAVDADIAFHAYEVWTPLADFDDVSDITDVMTTKLTAVRAYGSQLETFRYDDAVEGLDRFRGALAGHCEYAEVFRTDASD
jgi:LmbE family N-acetylglucosaminyl deacetylase